jgi:sugar lactone lactonase YvrE
MKDVAIVIVLLLAAAGVCDADEYSDARADLVAAYQAQDYPAMRNAAARALAARPGYPGALFNRALAEVLDGDAGAALQTLEGLALQGIDFGVADIPEFESLKKLPGWDDYATTVEWLNEVQGNGAVVFSHDTGDFVPEGIAIGKDGELYLGSIRHGTIVRIGEVAEVLSEGKEHWSVFGMRLDGNGGLWFASASVPQYAGENAEPGRTGLFHLDLSNGEVDVRALLPEGEQAMVLGDLVIADADTIYTTESLTGAVLRYSISANEFTEVAAAGKMRSAQGLVLDASGEHLYVADYVGGLFRIALSDNALDRVTSPDSINLYGIDGLYRYADELIAIQNGIRPHRVVALELSPGGLSVTAGRVLAMNLPEFDEPTLGTVVGGDFYFVANSHWNRFDRDGNLPDGLAGPIVLKTELDDQR